MTKDKPRMVCDECGQPFGDVAWAYADPFGPPKFYCDDCHRKAQDDEGEAND